MQKEALVQEFNNQLLDSRVNFVNEFLRSFLEVKPDIKNLLVEYFKTVKIGYDGFKTFDLCGLSGVDQSHFVIVEVEDKFLFGKTSYGMLGPLRHEGFTYFQKIIIRVVLDFFNNPEKYFER